MAIDIFEFSENLRKNTDAQILKHKQREQYELEHPEEMSVYHADYMRIRVHEMD
jgi:hypothetical protein